MIAEVRDYVETHRVGVLAVEMPDGSPHAATVHFALSGEPPVFVFETSRRSRKAEPLFIGPARASFVVGFTEGPTEKTLQVDGEARPLRDDESVHKDAYLAKFPEKAAKAADPDNIFFIFTPTWWRFTDWGGAKGKTVYLSDGTVTTS